MRPLPSRDDPAVIAFPPQLAGDTRAVPAVMPVSRLRPVAPFPVVVHGCPGRTLLDLMRAAASDRAGRPWPSLTPGSRTRLDGHC